MHSMVNSNGCFGNQGADYILTVHLAALHNPSQVLVNEDCCVTPPVNQSSCSSPCNTTLKVCVREEGLDPADNSCPFTELIVAAQSNGEWRTVLPGAWIGSLQFHITVIHDLTASLGPMSPGDPVIGDLIDFIVIEQVLLSSTNPPAPLVNYTGRFNVATAEMAFSVACTYDFFGESCDLPCPSGRNDSLGRYRCDGNGSRACLEGYRDIETNCTTCIPLDGCSEIGGACTSPGECICRPGYSGRTCSENGTKSTTTSSPLPTPLPPSTMPTVPTTPTRADGVNLLPVTITSTSRVVFSSSALMDGTSLMSSIAHTPVNNFVQALISSTAIRLAPLTSTPTPVNVIPPTVSPAIPILPSPSPSNALSIVLGSIIGPLLMMIAISLIVFLISLTLTSWKKQKSSATKGRANDLYTQRNQPEDNILVNVAAISSSQSHGGSHSDLGHSLAETLPDPTYTTFLDDNGAFTHETLMEQGIDSDRISVLELGTRRKRNLTELEESIELRFQDADSGEMSIGGDLLGSIQQSLSQVGGFSIKHLSTNNDHLDSVDLGSDYAPSFIYTDMFVEEDNGAFRTPSLSLDSEPA
ncbi:uncharacterized protein LOC135331588 isoform X2 [Halichondria panicea]|uniref:uncharacterized protein LOC135331588 isoform X2 n=1 Tax=Halichondria panicea TaxID=6063 RepID=UPI00312B892E